MNFTDCFSLGQARDGVLVAAANLPLFKNAPISRLLSEKLNGVKVVLVNDADAALAAELKSTQTRHLYKDVKHAALVTIGTGIGVGLYLNNQLHQGHNGLVEAGHMIVNTSLFARQCSCGQVYHWSFLPHYD